MNKRFRCGRLVLTKNNTVQKLSLAKGGGSRFCKWFHKWMTFKYVRGQLIKLYNLEDSEYEVTLYDYQLQPLDLQRYHTVWEYVRDNGLSCNGTLIYLCTPEVDNGESSKKVVKKKKKEQSNSTTTTSIKYEPEPEPEPVIKIEPDSNLQQRNLSLFEYSFKNVNNDLIKYIRDLVIQYPGDEILIQLFEDSCVMYGYVSSIIEPLQRTLCLQLKNSSEHLNGLNDIQSICQSIETLINLNKEKLNQMEIFLIINEIFITFHQNLQNFRNQLVEYDQTNNESDKTSSNNRKMDIASYSSSHLYKNKKNNE